MCFDTCTNNVPDYSKKGVGYRLFKKDKTIGAYVGLWHGVDEYHIGMTYEAPRGYTKDSSGDSASTFIRGFHVFKSKRKAIQYKLAVDIYNTNCSFNPDTDVICVAKVAWEGLMSEGIINVEGILFNAQCVKWMTVIEDYGDVYDLYDQMFSKPKAKKKKRGKRR